MQGPVVAAAARRCYPVVVVAVTQTPFLTRDGCVTGARGAHVVLGVSQGSQRSVFF